jgi:CubicO group peptidase (beta-lactamase class C family)
MHLVQEGKLDLDAPVGQYLTRWQLPNSEFDPQEVTLRRLLSHSAGLSLHGYAGFDPDVQRPSVEASLAGETNGSGGVFIQSIPGSKWSYSGGGYTLMQLLVEEVSGLSFSDYVSQHVLAPLQMRNSSYFPTEQQLTATAQAHNFQLGTLPNYRFTAEAAAGLHATAEDLAKFEIANMTTNTVLDDGWVRLMHTAVIQVGSDNMGLGFFLQADDKVVGHGGSNMGWKASIKFVPETGSGVVVLTNSDSGSRLINDVNCYWNEHFDINHLTPMCEKLRAEQAQLNQIITVVSSILALAIATIGFLIYRRRVVFGYQVALSPPLHKRSLVLFFLSIALLVWFLFWHTTVGVYLIAGLPLFRAIDLLPAGSNYISWELMLLIGLFASLTVIKPQREPSSSGTSANKAENQTDTTPANESMQD